MVLLIAFKLAPAYFEYFAIEKQFKAIANDPSCAPGPAARSKARSGGARTIENITSIGPGGYPDHEGRRIGGRSAREYSVKVPLVG